jgi:hypothetical protein
VRPLTGPDIDEILRFNPEGMEEYARKKALLGDE